MDVRKVKNFIYGIWILIFFGAGILRLAFPEAALSNASFFPEVILSIEVNTITIIMTLGMVGLAVAIHYLVFKGLGDDIDISTFFGLSLIYMFLMLGYSNNPAGWLRGFYWFTILLGLETFYLKRTGVLPKKA